MVKIDFKDKIVNGSVPENLFLQTVTIGRNQKQTLNLYMQGLLYNPNDFSVEIIINSATGNFKKTLNPKQYFSIPYVLIYTVVNTGNGDIILYYSNSTYGQFSTGELINILGSVNITNDTLNINGNVTGSMEITNSSINVLGSVNITDEVNTYITNPSLNVLGSVNISNSITGSVEISNPSLNVLGSVNIVNDISGTVNINNPSLNVLGSVNITNDISGSVEISNPNINIIGSVNIDNQVNTDAGSYSINNQENMTSGHDIYIYNPWNYDTSNSYNPNSYNGYSQGNVQQNGARGYISRFYFYIYNPTSSSGSNTITVDLYTHLSESPTSTPITSFSFDTGTISANSGVWVVVQPNIFWDYNTLIVLPQQETYTSGTIIGVALNPSSYGTINTHSWQGSHWYTTNQGFIGYWELTNTSVASLPVTVQGGEVTITSTRRNPISIYGSFTGNNGTQIRPPINKKWKIRSIVLYWTANSTQTDYVEIQIVPNNVPYAYVLNLFYGSLSVTENDSYGVDIAEYVQSRTNQTITGSTFALTEQTINKELELYNTEALYLTVDNETATVDYYISYIEENIN